MEQLKYIFFYTLSVGSHEGQTVRPEQEVPLD